MSTPTQPMPATDVRAEITRFVAAVEQALDDLPRDDAAELTDGLEADLIEAWAVEGVRPGQRFGSPGAYATELRTAAGLPPEKRRRVNGPAAIRLQWQRDRDRLLTGLRAKPWWPQALEYGHELRPAWWALRGATLVLLTVLLIGTVLDLLPGLLVVSLPVAAWGAVISMRAGAADRAPRNIRGLVTIANVVTVGCLAVAGVAALSSSNGGDEDFSYDNAGSEAASSLVANGEPVSNVFAYDAAGKPITRFRLYDQAGRPLVVDGASREGYEDGTDNHWVSKPDAGDGPPEWNLFPLLKVTEHATGAVDADGNGVVEQVEGPVPPPYPQMPALPASTTPTGTAPATPTATPSAPSPTSGKGS